MDKFDKMLSIAFLGLAVLAVVLISACTPAGTQQLNSSFQASVPVVGELKFSN